MKHFNMFKEIGNKIMKKESGYKSDKVQVLKRIFRNEKLCIQQLDTPRETVTQGRVLKNVFRTQHRETKRWKM